MAGGDVNVGPHPVDESVDTDASSEAPTNPQHVGPDDEETPLNVNRFGHQNALMLEHMTGLIQNAMAQNRFDIERMMDEKLASKSAENHTPPPNSNTNHEKPPENETSRSRSTQITFKTFKGCGATEFDGSGDLAEACEWLDTIENAFDISNCWEADRVKYAVALLTKRARDWWKNTKKAMGDEKAKALSWKEFTEKFLTQYCPEDQRMKYEREFLELKQGNQSVAAYEAEFHKKSKFATDYLPTEMVRIRKFIQGLRWEIRELVEVQVNSTFEQAVAHARSREEAITLRNAETMPPPKKPHTDFQSHYSQSAAPGRSFSKGSFQSRSQSVRVKLIIMECVNHWNYMIKLLNVTEF